MVRLNIASWIACTEVEGPGKRFALWVQGCLLRCAGCCNPHMFELSPRNIMEAGEVWGLIQAAKDSHGIEGVTFLGGEPMLQARGLAEVARLCRKSGLSVVVFTGYTLEQLKENPLPGVPELLSETDLLIDGAFEAGQPEAERNWVGSANQRFHYLTDRYSPAIECDPKYPHGFELRLSKDGTLQINGWPVDGIFDRAERSLTKE